MKYRLSPREIPRAEPEGFPVGSGDISSYTPTRVTIQSFSIIEECNVPYKSSIGPYKTHIHLQLHPLIRPLEARHLPQVVVLAVVVVVLAVAVVVVLVMLA